MSSPRYSPGERHLALAGEFIRYYRAFRDAIENNVGTISDDDVFDLSAQVFLHDMDASAEITNAIALDAHFNQPPQDEDPTEKYSEFFHWLSERNN